MVNTVDAYELEQPSYGCFSISMHGDKNVAMGCSYVRFLILCRTYLVSVLSTAFANA